MSREVEDVSENPRAGAAGSSPASTEPITTPAGREVAPGGWRRAVTGLVVGAAAGLVHRVAQELDRERDHELDRGGGAGGGT